MTFWQEVALVFTEIGWIPAICLILGMILIIVEIFQPGFGFFGIAGGILVVIGIIVRIYNSGGGNPIIQFFVLLAIVLGVLALAAVIIEVILNSTFLDTERRRKFGETEVKQKWRFNQSLVSLNSHLQIWSS